MLGEVVHSQCGYGTIINEGEISTVKLAWGATGYFQSSEFSKEIPLRVKSFGKDRSQELTFSWPVTKNFETLFEQVAESLGLPSDECLSLVYPRGFLSKLSPSASPFSLQLSPHTRFVALLKKSFCWNEGKKGENIVLTNNKLTAQKQTEEYYETVLGTICLKGGSYQWELKVDSFIDEEDIFIGVALENIGLNMRPHDTGRFWGYMSAGSVKLAPEREAEEYGDPLRVGDIIGVKLEYAGQLGQLSFTKNGTELGVAFSDIPVNVFPALCLLYSMSQVTLISNF